MKKRIFLSLSVLFMNISGAFAQEIVNEDLRDKSVRFFVNSLDWVSKKNDNIIPEFLVHHNNRILYSYNNIDLDLLKKLNSTKNSNPEWKGKSDGYFSVSKKFNPKYDAVLVSDAAAASKSPYDINMEVYNVLQDAEFYYVAMKFKSVGKLEIFYTGDFICKYDREGNLVKYSYIER